MTGKRTGKRGRPPKKTNASMNEDNAAPGLQYPLPGEPSTSSGYTLSQNQQPLGRKLPFRYDNSFSQPFFHHGSQRKTSEPSFSQASGSNTSGDQSRSYHASSSQIATHMAHHHSNSHSRRKKSVPNLIPIMQSGMNKQQSNLPPNNEFNATGHQSYIPAVNDAQNISQHSIYHNYTANRMRSLTYPPHFNDQSMPTSSQGDQLPISNEQNQSALHPVQSDNSSQQPSSQEFPSPICRQACCASHIYAPPQHEPIVIHHHPPFPESRHETRVQLHPISSPSSHPNSSQPLHPSSSQLLHPSPSRPLHHNSSQPLYSISSQSMHPHSSQSMHPHSSQSLHLNSSISLHPTSSQPNSSQQLHHSSSQPSHANSSQYLHPHSSQSVHPHSFQNVHPNSSQSVHSNSSQSVHPNSSQHLHPNLSQALHPNSSQTLYPNSSQPLYPNSSQRLHPKSPQHLQPNSSQTLQLNSSHTLQLNSSQSLQLNSSQTLQLNSYQPLHPNASQIKQQNPSPPFHPSLPQPWNPNSSQSWHLNVSQNLTPHSSQTLHTNSPQHLHTNSPQHLHTNSPHHLHTNSPQHLHTNSPQPLHNNLPKPLNYNSPHPFPHDLSHSLHPNSPQALHPNSAQALHPNSAQALHPNSAQALHPNSAQALHPNLPQALHPNSPQALHPNSPQALHPNSPQALHPTSAQVLHPNSAQALHPVATHDLYPDLTHDLPPNSSYALYPNSSYDLHPNMSQALQPNLPQALHPNSSQALHPNSSQALHPNSPHALHPNSPHASHSNSSHALHTNPSQTLDPNLSKALYANSLQALDLQTDSSQHLHFKSTKPLHHNAFPSLHPVDVHTMDPNLSQSLQSNSAQQLAINQNYSGHLDPELDHSPQYLDTAYPKSMSSHINVPQPSASQSSSHSSPRPIDLSLIPRLQPHPSPQATGESSELSEDRTLFKIIESTIERSFMADEPVREAQLVIMPSNTISDIKPSTSHYSQGTVQSSCLPDLKANSRGDSPLNLRDMITFLDEDEEPSLITNTENTHENTNAEFNGYTNCSILTENQPISNNSQRTQDFKLAVLPSTPSDLGQQPQGCNNQSSMISTVKEGLHKSTAASSSPLIKESSKYANDAIIKQLEAGGISFLPVGNDSLTATTPESHHSPEVEISLITQWPNSHHLVSDSQHSASLGLERFECYENRPLSGNASEVKNAFKINSTDFPKASNKLLPSLSGQNSLPSIHLPTPCREQLGSSNQQVQVFEQDLQGRNLRAEDFEMASQHYETRFSHSDHRSSILPHEYQPNLEMQQFAQVGQTMHRTEQQLPMTPHEPSHSVVSKESYRCPVKRLPSSEYGVHNGQPAILRSLTSHQELSQARYEFSLKDEHNLHNYQPGITTLSVQNEQSPYQGFQSQQDQSSPIASQIQHSITDSSPGQHRLSHSIQIPPIIHENSVAAAGQNINIENKNMVSQLAYAKKQSPCYDHLTNNPYSPLPLNEYGKTGIHQISVSNDNSMPVHPSPSVNSRSSPIGQQHLSSGDRDFYSTAKLPVAAHKLSPDKQLPPAAAQESSVSPVKGEKLYSKHHLSWNRNVPLPLNREMMSPAEDQQSPQKDIMSPDLHLLPRLRHKNFQFKRQLYPKKVAKRIPSPSEEFAVSKDNYIFNEELNANESASYVSFPSEDQPSSGQQLTSVEHSLIPQRKLMVSIKYNKQTGGYTSSHIDEAPSLTGTNSSPSNESSSCSLINNAVPSPSYNENKSSPLAKTVEPEETNPQTDDSNSINEHPFTPCDEIFQNHIQGSDVHGLYLLRDPQACVDEENPQSKYNFRERRKTISHHSYPQESWVLSPLKISRNETKLPSELEGNTLVASSSSKCEMVYTDNELTTTNSLMPCDQGKKASKFGKSELKKLKFQRDKYTAISRKYEAKSEKIRPFPYSGILKLSAKDNLVTSDKNILSHAQHKPVSSFKPIKRLSKENKSRFSKTVKETNEKKTLSSAKKSRTYQKHLIPPHGKSKAKVKTKFSWYNSATSPLLETSTKRSDFLQYLTNSSAENPPSSSQDSMYFPMFNPTIDPKAKNFVRKEKTTVALCELKPQISQRRLENSKLKRYTKKKVIFDENIKISDRYKCIQETHKQQFPKSKFKRKGMYKSSRAKKRASVLRKTCYTRTTLQHMYTSPVLDTMGEDSLPILAIPINYSTSSDYFPYLYAFIPNGNHKVIQDPYPDLMKEGTQHQTRNVVTTINYCSNIVASGADRPFDISSANRTPEDKSGASHDPYQVKNEAQNKGYMHFQGKNRRPLAHSHTGELWFSKVYRNYLHFIQCLPVTDSFLPDQMDWTSEEYKPLRHE